jgi:hypothetical protein
MTKHKSDFPSCILISTDDDHDIQRINNSSPLCCFYHCVLECHSLKVQLITAVHGTFWHIIHFQTDTFYLSSSNIFHWVTHWHRSSYHNLLLLFHKYEGISSNSVVACVFWPCSSVSLTMKKGTHLTFRPIRYKSPACRAQKQL